MLNYDILPTYVRHDSAHRVEPAHMGGRRDLGAPRLETAEFINANGGDHAGTSYTLPHRSGLSDALIGWASLSPNQYFKILKEAHQLARMI